MGHPSNRAGQLDRLLNENAGGIFVEGVRLSRPGIGKIRQRTRRSVTGGRKATRAKPEPRFGLPNLIIRLSDYRMKTVSVTEAARNFSDLVSRVHYQGESTLLIKGGRPMVIVAPARKARTGRELAALWPTGPHLSLKAAEAFESELVTAKSKLGPIESAWD